MDVKPRARPAARVLVVGPDDALLLFQFRGTEGLAWLTPGGGVHPGESVAEAAARELHEETGMTAGLGELGPVVACSEGQWSADGQVFDAHDSYFWLRVADTAVDTSRQEDLERSLIIGHRWWTVDELAATTDLVYPIGLAGLMRTLLTQGRPASPIRLPWRPDEG
ncbi:MAG: NUDIX hydrolase [Streptosporangiaceae bacterium]